jgi:hypothetical protein
VELAGLYYLKPTTFYSPLIVGFAWKASQVVVDSPEETSETWRKLTDLKTSLLSCT